MSLPVRAAFCGNCGLPVARWHADRCSGSGCGLNCTMIYYAFTTWSSVASSLQLPIL